MGWYQSLLPLGIMCGTYALSHFAVWGLDKLQNDGKDRRWSTDKFDRLMGLRDRRITGSENRQKAEL